MGASCGDLGGAWAALGPLLGARNGAKNSPGSTSERKQLKSHCWEHFLGFLGAQERRSREIRVSVLATTGTFRAQIVAVPEEYAWFR